MESLDLTKKPPRSPYDTLLGLYMLPRTIDKLRAELPGGKLGGYSIIGTIPGLAGLSLTLLEIDIKLEELRTAVSLCATEEEVVEWIHARADLSDVNGVNQRLVGSTLGDAEVYVPLERVMQVYPFLREWPKSTPRFDLVLRDDLHHFPN
ncbi:MAG: DUF5069 domain-containing protein [Verrucomicrobia bacterium]|nr:DUF5069 domain-containing protein [Verrucomicrobiota bacterium]